MKVNSNLAVLFWLNGKVDTEGKKNLYARLTVNGVRAEVSLGKKVPVLLWNQDKGHIEDTSKVSMLINRHIDEAKVKFQQHYDTLELQHELVTSEMVKNAYLGVKKQKKTLIEVTDFLLKRMEEKVVKKLLAPATLTKWNTTKTKILQFLAEEKKGKDYPLINVDYSFAEDFFDYLTLKQDLIPNSASKYIKNLKKIMKTAVQRNWIKHNPTQEFVCQYIHPERDILNEEELIYMHHKKFQNSRLQEAKDSYVFMCFTGYAFKDTSGLSPLEVVKFFDGEDWIIKNREKTWCKENVPLLPIAKEIIDKYKNHPYCLKHNKLLPIRSNQKFNEYLKEIAALCNINKDLTTHTARHTFATTVTLANGVPLETVSALLGHKSIKSTQIYAKIVAAKISKDMKKLKEQWIEKIPASMLTKQAA